MSDDANQHSRSERIRSKIAASQARSRGDAAPRRAKPAPRQRPPDEPTFVKRAITGHPLAALAGGLVLGAVAASLVPRSWGRKLGGRMLGLATVAADLGATYGGKAWEAAAENVREAGGGALKALTDLSDRTRS